MQMLFNCHRNTLFNNESYASTTFFNFTIIKSRIVKSPFENSYAKISNFLYSATLAPIISQVMSDPANS